ncbi:glycerol kinase GlpK [Arhodomonas aquaeolei]|uniref:glycerol kinase GlpK n=1 Tax=Arhodomonas aquaeolei TaxID=2369 RepID=UPI00037246CE|nr:glycerol kinase GlpK [Arhodomonas aquaeolei]
MAQQQAILAIDQGTTSSRAIVFDLEGRIVSSAQQEFPQHYPHSGWVEHDPEDLWQSTVSVCRQAMDDAAERGATVVTLGITNQRETTVIWDRDTGHAVAPAIVWQDRRTADWCAELRGQGAAATVTERTGLLLDPYFSATKIAWILDNVPGTRERARDGRLAFGTVDSWLLWRLTGGRIHATDATNASRTMLFNIREQHWDDDLLALFDVPRALLPAVHDSAADFGETLPNIFGRSIPVRGIAGDQHAAVVGQCCFSPGMVKSTYGTGCFALLNTGDTPVASSHHLLTTLAYRIDGRPTYALEGSIFVAGAALQWLRDGLGVITTAAESERLARELPDNAGVYMVPAFTGLGAPHWDPDARGAIFGLSRDTGVAELARAALESVCYQTHDLLVAMAGDAGAAAELRVDGGMVANDWFLQTLSDIVGERVVRPQVIETTALGAAYLAGIGQGIWGSLEEIRSQWQTDRAFDPDLPRAQRERQLAGWADAVRRVTSR